MDILHQFQKDAIGNMHNGCILCGDVGTGKSITSLGYYYKECGGDINDISFGGMKNPIDLYIITTARKRDTFEWEGELARYDISKDPMLSGYPEIKVVIDSWNNIKKYTTVKNSFFIFDEQRLVGSGVWVKSFYQIARNNKWIILSATPGDAWVDYIPVFVANGFYRNKSDFIAQHVVYESYTNFPKIKGYIGTRKLEAERESLLVGMNYEKQTIRHHIDILCDYDKVVYRTIMKQRWNPWTEKPIENVSELCHCLRKCINSDSRRLWELTNLVTNGYFGENELVQSDRFIIFYNFDYELEAIKRCNFGDDVAVAEWNGHKHEPIPSTDKWVYLVQYTAGAEGWNCIETDTIIFFSQTYSYKSLIQSCGRIDRLNTPFKDLYFFHLFSKAPLDLVIKRALASKKQFNERKYFK